MSKFSLLTLSILYFNTLISCARPNYQKSETTENQIQSGDNPSPILPEKPENKISSECDLSFQKINYCVKFTWQLKPTESDFGLIHLKFYSLSDSLTPVDPPGDVTLLLWMPQMGHGSSPTKTKHISSGVFLIENVFFIMPGEWEMRIQVKDKTNILDQVVQKITI